MKNPVRFAIAMVVAHLILNFAHGSAHDRLQIGLTPAELDFVWGDILIAPLVAAVLLLTKWRRIGAALLTISMAGAFAFGVYKHFLAAGADNAFGVAAGTWGTTFLATSFLLALTEALACWAGIAVLKQK